MTAKDKKRLAMLRGGPDANLEYLKDYYGLDWPLSDANADVFDAFLRPSHSRQKHRKGMVSRIDIEGFMALNDLLPRKWAAAQMGMTTESLGEILKKIDTIGMLRSRYEVGNEFVADSLRDDLVRHLPGIRFLVFSNHTDFCRRLHAEASKTLKVQIEPLFCATSDFLQEDPRRFAAHFDCITLQPLSTYHSLWLNFHKPLNLPPDRCSKLYYAKNKGTLSPFLLNQGAGDSKNLLKYRQSRVSA